MVGNSVETVHFLALKLPTTRFPIAAHINDYDCTYLILLMKAKVTQNGNRPTDCIPRFEERPYGNYPSLARSIAWSIQQTPKWE